MSTLSQVGRGAVLLTSMALVACYIDVYATGKFPWQHAAADIPATVPPPEWTSDPTVQQIQYVEAPATQEQRMFMAGSKSDVAASAIVVQAPTANAQTTTATTTTPLFLSGTKTFTGQTMVLPGTLTLPPSPTPTEQKAPAFMGGGKTLMLSPRLPETTTTSPPPVVSPDKMQFMSGFKSPGPSVMQGTSLPTLPQSAPPGIPPATYPQSPSTNNQSFQPNVSPQQDKHLQKPASGNANGPNSAPQFMSGSKSPFSRIPTPQQTAPVQQQTAPLKIAPPNAPLSPAGSY